MASTPEERATRAIPLLRARLAELCALSRESACNIRFADEDHFAFMALVFHAKQVEHAEAVLLLGDHPDASLIARSMMEGMWQLKWAAQDAKERALRWRMFSVIYDWRVLQQKIAAGSPELTVARQRKIEGRLPDAHEQFLTRRARDRRDKGLPLPADPYQATWSGMAARDLAEATGDLELYAGPYEDFSDRHHWSPAGIGFSIRQRGVRLYYEGKAATSVATALSVAFQCLMEVSLALTEHLATGFEDRLMALTERYLNEHEKIRTTAGDAPPASAM